MMVTVSVKLPRAKAYVYQSLFPQKKQKDQRSRQWVRRPEPTWSCFRSWKVEFSQALQIHS